MIYGASPTIQALLATLFTWFVTALGAGLVFLVPRTLAERKQRQLLDASLGFAAGVMLAASYWSLLAPALEFAEKSGSYGNHSYIPVSLGLLLGAAFVYGADCCIPHEAGDAVAVLTRSAAASASASAASGTAPQSDGRRKKDDGADERPFTSSAAQVSQQASALSRTLSLSRKRNASSARLSVGAATPNDFDVDEMEAHRLSPSSSVSSQGQNGRQVSSSSSGSGKKSGASSRRSGSSSSRKKSTRRKPSMAGLDLDALSEGPIAESPTFSPVGSASSGVGASASSTSGTVPVSDADRRASWHRILLLVIAIVIHNFPEGLAVGVGFGALASVQPLDPSAAAAATVTAAVTSSSPGVAIDAAGINATAALAAAEAIRAEQYASLFADARNLAFGIGLQNAPEGLAVSLPLLRVGYSRTEAFMYGQLSGMVEPIGGLLGAALIGWMEPVLPYALAFAAGAMIFVVVEDLVPETRAPGGFPTLASAFTMVGFVVMMSMDVGLG